MSKVALIKTDDYAYSYENIRKAFELIGGIKNLIRPHSKILLKPNLCNPTRGDSPAITNPEFIKGVILALQDTNSEIYLGDIPAVEEEGITRRILQESGIGKVLIETKTKFANLENAPYIAKEIPNYKILEKTDFSKAYFDFDVIINLPKLKSHGISYITGAVKNMFGLIHMQERKFLHSQFQSIDDFSNGIVDTYSFMKPKINLTIMDAVIAMEGDEGPSYGPPTKIGYILVSEDGVAIDAVASKITGHAPLNIPTTRFADQRNIGEGRLENIEIIGDPLEIKPFNKHTNYIKRYEVSNNNIISNNISTNINKDDHDKHQNSSDEITNDINSRTSLEITNNCVKCGRCIKACPVGAIEYKNNKFIIDQEKCIKCFCCVENCVFKAIKTYTNFEKKEINSNNSNSNATKKGNNYKNVNPKTANIRLGLECNQKCKFCTTSDDPDDTLSTEEVLIKIDYLHNNEKVTNIALTGGEPTIRNDLPDIIEYATKQGLSVELQTNGIKLSDNNYLTKLIQNGLKQITISFHSHIKEKYNSITNSDCYEEALQGLKNVLDKNIPISISHVINEINYRDINDFIDFIKEKTDRKDIVFYLSFLRPNGRTKEYKNLIPRLSKIEIELFNTIKKLETEGFGILIEGVPACYMQDFVKYNAEIQRTKDYKEKNTSQILVGTKTQTHKNLHEFINSNLKTKSENCKICVYDKTCPGVWREYAQIYGTDELYPIFSSKNQNNN